MNKELSQKLIDDFSEAERLCNENKLNESLEIYKALLKVLPNHISVLNNTGLVYEKLGDFNKSIDLYIKCNELAPDQVILINNLANAYTRMDRWEDAYPLLKKIIDLDYENESNSEKYALCLFNIKSKGETKSFIGSAIAKYPENRLLNRLLGRSLLELNSHIEGLKYLRKGSGFIQFDPDGVKYLN